MRPSLNNVVRAALGLLLLAAVFVFQALPVTLTLPPELKVSRDGVQLRDLAPDATDLPEVRLAAAPEFGRVLFLSRVQITAALKQAAPQLTVTNWTGPAQTKVSRRTRRLEETELLNALTETLQREAVRDAGTLELKLNRPWPGANIPDEPFTVKLTDQPGSGLQAHGIVRFELRGEQESFGVFSVAIDAKVWAEVWVARATIPRGLGLRDAEILRERRDLLTLRGSPAQISPDDDRLEFGESVAAGSPIIARALRLRPVVRRGKLVDAVVMNGQLSITVRAEALDDGAPGQVVRVRNLKSRREFRGKVQDEQTILVSL